MNDYEKIYEEWKQKFDAMSSAEQKECLRKFGLLFTINSKEIIRCESQNETGEDPYWRLSGNVVKIEPGMGPHNLGFMASEETIKLEPATESELRKLLSHWEKHHKELQNPDSVTLEEEQGNLIAIILDPSTKNKEGKFAQNILSRSEKDPTQYIQTLRKRERYLKPNLKRRKMKYRLKDN